MDMDHIKNRVLEFLRSENITSAQFAQEIGVQPSGISHIISGRNKPSLDLIVKMLSRYPAVSTDWLLFGKGNMFREGTSIDIFSSTKEDLTSGRDIFSDNFRENIKKTDPDEAKISPGQADIRHREPSNKPRTSRIVIFNADGTFSEHYPG
jgi:transcriptional regulator with XRE-family HTH domain